jgi:hypothetical protein
MHEQGIGRESPVVCMKYVGAVVVFHTLLAVSDKFLVTAVVFGFGF